MMPQSAQIPRIVGFVSSVVGLICYALSSSFNHVFGKWNFLKIFLYSIFSFTISFTTLFAKICQFSPRPLFKAHVAVLVLLATTVYSFFYDKAVNEKPDAYILISCAAFAVMSLCLSKLTQCGCEVDLVNYFMGCIIILLMKINLWLFVVGACFSYSLIILRSYSELTPQTGYSDLRDHQLIRADSQHVNIDNVIQIDLHVNNDSVIQVDSLNVNTDSDVQVAPPQVDDALMLLELELKTSISELKQNDFVIIRHIETNVKKYLEVCNFSKDHMVTDDNLLIDSLPPDAINRLHNTINLMIVGGFEKECCHEYTSYRREFLRKSLKRLQLSKFNSKKSFQFFATEEWVKASMVALNILFPNERRLCDRVFSGFSSIADLSFMEVCRELTTKLLDFPINLATEKHSVNDCNYSLRVFKILEDLIPMFESLFSDDCSASLKNEAIMIWKRLDEAIRVNFMELENHICHDMTQNAVPNAMIDQITLNVANCFGFVLIRFRHEQQQRQPWLCFDRPSSFSFSSELEWIMELLESNLEAKSKKYIRPALAYAFLMNNWNYVAKRAKDSELATILGDDWIQKHTTSRLQKTLNSTKEHGILFWTF